MAAPLKRHRMKIQASEDKHGHRGWRWYCRTCKKQGRAVSTDWKYIASAAMGHVNRNHAGRY